MINALLSFFESYNKAARASAYVRSGRYDLAKKIMLD